MPRFRNIQNSFRGGEIAPDVHGRTDLDIWPHSCEEILNFICRNNGGVGKRPGSQFLKSELLLYRPSLVGAGPSETLNGGVPVALTGKVRIIPFIFSQDESYAVVLKNFSGQTGISIINTDDFTEAVVNGQVSYVHWIFSNFLTYASDAELDEIQYDQSGDLLFLMHPNYFPFQIVRTGLNTFSVRQFWLSPGILAEGGSQLGFLGERNVAYLPTNLDLNHTMSAVATLGGNNQTVTSSKSFFTTAMVGAVLKITSGGVTFYRFIHAFIDSMNVTTREIAGPKAAIPASSVWQISAWNAHFGFPRCLTLFEQRQFYGGTRTRPDTVWGSQIADLFEFDEIGAVTDPGFGVPVASDPFSFTVVSAEVNQLQWLSGGRVLNEGTLGREYTATGGQGALSAIDISVISETAHGSFFRQPLRLENALIFIQKTGRKLREFVFNRDQDSFRADDLSRLASHMIFKGANLLGSAAASPFIQALAKQETTESLVWCLDNNGYLFAATRDSQGGVSAWHHHILGGNYQDNYPFIQSIASITSGDGTSDDLWLGVTRTIDGSDVTYIERINKEFTGNLVFNSSASILDKMLYSDSALLFKPGGTFTTITGLTHLIDEEVVVVADGKYLGAFTVSALGEVVLPTDYTEAIVGLNYIARIKDLPLEAGSAIGSAQTAIKRVDEIGIRFVNSIGCKFGSNENDLETINFRPTTITMDDPIPLFTGDKVMKMPSDYDRKAQAIIQQDLPLPCIVTAITKRGMTYD
jgi:hypothetical protein